MIATAGFGTGTFSDGELERYERDTTGSVFVTHSRFVKCYTLNQPKLPPPKINRHWTRKGLKLLRIEPCKHKFMSRFFGAKSTVAPVFSMPFLAPMPVCMVPIHRIRADLRSESLAILPREKKWKRGK